MPEIVENFDLDEVIKEAGFNPTDSLSDARKNLAACMIYQTRRLLPPAERRMQPNPLKAGDVFKINGERLKQAKHCLTEQHRLDICSRNGVMPSEDQAKLQAAELFRRDYVAIEQALIKKGLGLAMGRGC